MQFSIESIKLNLKYVWKISRNSSEFKQNFIVKFEHKEVIGLGEVAPNIRYNETTETIENGFKLFVAKCNNKIGSIQELTAILNNLELPYALRFAIEQAYLNWHCKINQISLANFLGIAEPKHIATCYTLPIMEIGEIIPFYKKFNLNRFNQIKIKAGSQDNLAALNELIKVCDKPILIDGNEVWKNPDEVINFINSAKHLPIEFIEQPMPAALVDEYIYLKQHANIPLMADESCLANNDFNLLAKQFDGVNMKLMKAGGILNGLAIINEAKKHNLKTMVGCMVETTLGMSAAWLLSSLTNYADLDGYLIVVNEPFGLLTEKDGMVYKT